MSKNKCLDPEIWFVCKFCRRAFQRRKYLVRHKREFHPVRKDDGGGGGQQKDTVCTRDEESPRGNVARKSSGSRKLNKIEKKMSDSPPRSSLRMKEPKMTIKSESEVKTTTRTKKTVLETKEEEECPIFSIDGDLIGHRNPNRQPYSLRCLHCERGFRKQYDLQRHIFLHSGKRPFSCTFCNDSFMLKRELTFHLDKNH